MASTIQFTGTHLLFSSKPINKFPSSSPRLSSQFLGFQNNFAWLKPTRIGPSNGSRTQCWFKFGKNGVDAENAGIYGSQSRDDFDRDDVEQVIFHISFSAFTYINICVGWCYFSLCSFCCS